MGIDEYDAELHERTLIDIGYDRGHSDGINIGREQGISQTITTTISLLKENGFSDNKIIEILINKYKLSSEQAKKYIVKI